MILDELNNATQLPIVPYLRFLQQYRFNEDTFHFFFEGYDDRSFYTNYIEDYLRDDHKRFYYNCNNKSGVIDNFEKINWDRYKRERVLFFIDKDHSDLTNQAIYTEKNIFITKYYSIENYLVNHRILIRILTELLRITDENLINSLVELFEQQHKKFINLMNIITSWILLQRINNSKPNLNNINLSKIFSISNELIIIKNRYPDRLSLLKYLEKETSVKTIHNCWKNILSFYRTIKEIDNHKKHLRGKFELWFLIKFTMKIPDILNRHKKNGEKKYKYNLTLCSTNAVNILAPRLIIPDDIEEFLDANITSYLGSKNTLS